MQANDGVNLLTSTSHICCNHPPCTRRAVAYGSAVAGSATVSGHPAPKTMRRVAGTQKTPQVQDRRLQPADMPRSVCTSNSGSRREPAPSQKHMWQPDCRREEPLTVTSRGPRLAPEAQQSHARLLQIYICAPLGNPRCPQRSWFTGRGGPSSTARQALHPALEPRHGRPAKPPGPELCKLAVGHRRAQGGDACQTAPGRSRAAPAARGRKWSLC